MAGPRKVRLLLIHWMMSIITTAVAAEHSSSEVRASGAQLIRRVSPLSGLIQKDKKERTLGAEVQGLRDQLGATRQAMRKEEANSEVMKEEIDKLHRNAKAEQESRLADEEWIRHNVQEMGKKLMSDSRDLRPFAVDSDAKTVTLDNYNLIVKSSSQTTGLGNLVVGNDETFAQTDNRLFPGGPAALKVVGSSVSGGRIQPSSVANGKSQTTNPTVEVAEHVAASSSLGEKRQAAKHKRLAATLLSALAAACGDGVMSMAIAGVVASAIGAAIWRFAIYAGTEAANAETPTSYS